MDSEVKLPQGWREVLKRARDGLGAGGHVGVSGHGQRELEITIGGALLDHVEDELAALAAQPTREAVLDLAVRLVNAVECGGYSGLSCEDVAEGNWFDARETLAAALTGDPR